MCDVCLQETLISAGNSHVSREELPTVVDMLVTVFLAMLLMIAGIGRAAMSDLQLNEKFNDRTLSGREGRHSMRKQLHHQVNAI